MGALSEWAARLAIPGLPEWSGLVALLLLMLVALAYLLMPFAVFGLKGRLEGIEAQLDELQTELRALALRMADVPRRPPAEEWTDLPTPLRTEQVAPRATPPVPPPAAYPDRGTARQEPRLDLPHRR